MARDCQLISFASYEMLASAIERPWAWPAVIAYLVQVKPDESARTWGSIVYPDGGAEEIHDALGKLQPAIGLEGQEGQVSLACDDSNSQNRATQLGRSERRARPDIVKSAREKLSRQLFDRARGANCVLSSARTPGPRPDLNV